MEKKRRYLPHHYSVKGRMGFGHEICVYSPFNIKGVPRNMTVSSRIECRLRTLSLFVTFSRQPTFTCIVLETKTTIVLTFWKSGLLFCAVNITGDIKNFVSISISSNKTKIVEISGICNIESKKGRSHFGIAKSTIGILWLINLEFYFYNY